MFGLGRLEPRCWEGAVHCERRDAEPPAGGADLAAAGSRSHCPAGAASRLRWTVGARWPRAACRLLFAPLGREWPEPRVVDGAAWSACSGVPDGQRRSLCSGPVGCPPAGLWSLLWRPHGPLRLHKSPLEAVVWRE